jgi:uncharacterized RDD family membrane protein YckC
VSVVGATYRLMASVATPTAQRTLDELLDGALPEVLGSALRRHKVLERIAAAYGEDALEDRAQEVLRSPAAQQLLQSAAAQQLLAEILESPAVRRALVRQSTSFADDITAMVRRHARTADTALSLADAHSLRASSYAGLVTRATAFVVDAAIVLATLLLAGGALAVVTALIGPLRPAWLAGTLLAAAALAANVAYFAGFWSTVGQTPGMRLMRIRVVSTTRARLGFGRSLLRLAAVVIAAIPCFAGFLPVLFDSRRRALPDYVGRTSVISTAN